MEKHPTAKHKKRSQNPNKKTPVKVVYISNPMKIKASPSEFRAVVQHLTGRYATSPPPSYHQLPTILINKDNNHNHQPHEQEQEQEQEQETVVDHQDKWQPSSTRSDVSYESTCREDDQVMDDFIITPQMLDGFSPLLPSDFGS